MASRRFATFAWSVLVYNLGVILWGAFVRATGSGAGCGSHWPLCNGVVIPPTAATETLIEFSHRLSSGVALLAVLALVPWAWRIYPTGHRVRKAAVASLILIIVEALIGAGLVLLELVADNVSIARAYWMAGHLINTFILLGALTAWWASGAPAMRLRGQPAILLGTLAAALIAMLILGASGSITALGDTLVLTAGYTSEEPLVATLISLRLSHPLLAIAVGVLVGIAAWVAQRRQPSQKLPRLVRGLAALYLAQLIIGAFNVALRAPVAMQLVHLLMADLIWITLVMLAASALAVPGEAAMPDAAATPTLDGPRDASLRSA